MLRPNADHQTSLLAELGNHLHVTLIVGHERLSGHSMNMRLFRWSSAGHRPRVPSATSGLQAEENGGLNPMDWMESNRLDEEVMLFDASY